MVFSTRWSEESWWGARLSLRHSLKRGTVKSLKREARWSQTAATGEIPRSTLPDADALLRVEVKFLPRFHGISIVPRVDIAHGLDALTIGRVLVGDNF